MPDDPRAAPPPVSVDLLRSVARAQGLDLSDTELAALIPLVTVGRDPLSEAPDMPPDTEPAARFTVVP